jgi:hypothetical protein
VNRDAGSQVPAPNLNPPRGDHDRALELGGVLVGNEVRILLEVQAVKAG